MWEIYISTLMAAATGAIGSIIFLLVLRNKVIASRIVDLVGFSLTGIGLIVSIIAIENYEKRISGQRERINLASASFEAVKKIEKIVDDICPRAISPSPRQPDLDRNTADCKALRDYLQALRNLEHVRGSKFPPPPWVTGTLERIDIFKGGGEIETEVYRHNVRVDESLLAELEGRFSSADAADYKSIVIALLVFAAAFGMGIVRRGFDLFSWKHSIPQRKRYALVDRPKKKSSRKPLRS